MRERPALDLATLRARCPVVVDRRLATRLQIGVLAAATLAWPPAIVVMARGWPLWAQVPAGIALVVGLLLLATLVRHASRSGSFRLAADEHRVYFREEIGGGLRALDWRHCRHLETISSHGERSVRLEFERHADEAPWESLCHAQVFLRDTSVEIISIDLPAAASLVERLEALRAAHGEPASDGDDGRAAA